MYPEIGVIIPVYNNQYSLEELHARIHKTLKEYSYKVIYINDCSIDDSFSILKQIESRYTEVAVIDLVKNIGQQRATLEGLKSLNKVKKIVVLDADLQDHPEWILSLYERCKDSIDTVYIKRSGLYQSIDRMITSTIIKFSIQLLSGLHRKAGSFYMMDQSILKEVIRLANDCPTPYLTLIVAHCSFKKKYVTKERRISKFGTSYNTKMRLKSAKEAIQCAVYCLIRRRSFL